MLLLKNLPRYECLLEAAQQFPDLDPSACEAFLHVLRAGDEAFHGCDEYMAAHNLSQGRFTVLMLLMDKGGEVPHTSTPAGLADLAGVARATMTGLIDTLEKDGLVRREPDPVDRRMMSVSLTQRGRDVLRQVLPEHFQRMAALMRPLSIPERKTLVHLLSKILGQAAAMKPGDGMPHPNGPLAEARVSTS
jgi:DNA-binding MarR family transcriptional regulator